MSAVVSSVCRLPVPQSSGVLVVASAVLVLASVVVVVESVMVVVASAVLVVASVVVEAMSEIKTTKPATKNISQRFVENSCLLKSSPSYIVLFCSHWV